MATTQRADLGQGQYAEIYRGAACETADEEIFVLCFHGGGGVAGEPAMLRDFCTEMVAASPRMRAAAVSYRTRNRDGAGLDDMLEDGARALEWARSQSQGAKARGARLYVLGASFGGLLALDAVRRAPDGVAGLILFNPVSDTGPGGFANEVVPAAGREDINPVRLYAEPGQRPRVHCLIAHGRADDVVPVEASRSFARLWPPVNCKLIEVPNAQHGFFNRQPHCTTMSDHVARFVAGGGQPGKGRAGPGNRSGAQPGGTPKSRAFPAKSFLLYCIGAQKAGTSWLYNTLGRSPDCLTTPFKEMHYFDVQRVPQESVHRTLRMRQLQTLSAELAGCDSGDDEKRLRKIATLAEVLQIYTGPPGNHRRYLSYLTAHHTGERVVCDFTPSYSVLDRDAFADMARLGRARFLYVMRDPVDRLWSQTRMMIADSGGDPLKDADFEAACLARLRQQKQDGSLGLAARADYARTMTELEAAVPAPRIHYAFYETLFSQQAVTRICRFLGIDPVPVEGGERINPGRSMELPEEAAALLMQALRPQYDAVFGKFGDAVPEAWRLRYASAT